MHSGTCAAAWQLRVAAVQGDMRELRESVIQLALEHVQLQDENANALNAGADRAAPPALNAGAAAVGDTGASQGPAARAAEDADAFADELAGTLLPAAGAARDVRVQAAVGSQHQATGAAAHAGVAAQPAASGADTGMLVDAAGRAAPAAMHDDSDDDFAPAATDSHAAPAGAGTHPEDHNAASAQLAAQLVVAQNHVGAATGAETQRPSPGGTQWDEDELMQLADAGRAANEQHGACASDRGDEDDQFDDMLVDV